MTEQTTEFLVEFEVNEAQLAGLVGALPLYDWMQIRVTPLAPHPNDPWISAKDRDSMRRTIRGRC